MRNYWALLPAIAVCVVLAVLYAVPTLINPQPVSNLGGLFRRDDDTERPALSPRDRRVRRFSAIAVLAAALVLVAFNVSLNREANSCYLVAKAWGADGSKSYKDPCVDMIMGAYFSNPDGEATEDDPQPVTSYQIVHGKRPAYLRWVQNRPEYHDADLIVGVQFLCDSDVKFTESAEAVTIVSDLADPCPPRPQVGLVSIKLKRPLGDREVVTVDGKPMQRIDPEMPSWGTVLKELATGG
ncbi:MAG TPA: hypothetical protein VEK80_00025 [Kribbellaceae bacterium]|nr:hypothetical protein [Kribbellaceae bacterium]